MTSELRRVARALVEHRTERFESRHSREESIARLEPALAALGLKGATRFHGDWKVEHGKVHLEAQFAPARRTRRFLNTSSLVLTLLLAAGAWALLGTQADRSIRFLVPLAAVFAILAFPFVAAALGSQREAEEARIRKAIRKALLEEDDKPPASRHRDDED
jgi:hypothetical protein